MAPQPHRLPDGKQPTSPRLKPMRLKRVRWTNQLVTRAHGLTFNANGEAFTLRLHARPPAGDPVISARLAVGEHTCWLGLDTLFARHWLQEYVPLERMGDVPKELRSAIVEAVLEKPLSVLERALGLNIEVEEVKQRLLPEEEAGAYLFISLVKGDSSHAAGARIVIDEALQELFAEAMGNLPLRVVPGWSWLPMIVRFEIGSVELIASEYRQLGSGDLLLPDSFFLSYEQSVRIRLLPNTFIDGKLEKNTVVVQKIPEITVAEEQAKSGAVNLDELPINLVFDIGEKSLTLKELQSLQPGYVFELERTLDRPVHLRIHGHRIGTGELVQIEDRIGVRIMELYRRPD